MGPGSFQQTENHDSGASEKCCLQAVGGVSTFGFLQSSLVSTCMILFPLIACDLWRKCQPLCAVLAPMAVTVGLSVGPGSVPVATHPHQIKFMSWEREQSHPELCPCSADPSLAAKHFGRRVQQRIFQKSLDILPYKYHYKAWTELMVLKFSWSSWIMPPVLLFRKTRLRMIICQYNNSEMGYKWKIFHLVAYFLFPETFGRLSSTAASLCTSVGAEVGSRVMGRWEVGTLRGRILSKLNLETPKMSQKYLKQKKLVFLHNFCWSPEILLCIGQFLRSTVRGEKSLIMWKTEIELCCNTILPFFFFFFSPNSLLVFTAFGDRHPKSHQLLSHVTLINTFIAMSRRMSKSN